MIAIHSDNIYMQGDADALVYVSVTYVYNTYIHNTDACGEADLEHFPSSFTVRCRQNGSVYVLESRFPEELVGGKGQGAAHAGDRPKCVCSRPQMGDGT